MSQNRFRRDGRQSYQMNSGGGYGNRSGQQMNVNPWEGGLVPGGPRNVAGLLPTPPQTSNLLSQLSSTEAQLAIASNLLTSLLRPQQQTPQVPSLLSLGQMGNMNSGSGYRQGYGQGMGRYQDPGPNRRKRIESRRAEPYNKSSQGRRPAPTRGGPDRKPGNQGLRSPSVGKSRSGSKPGGKADKKDDEKDPKKDKDQEDDKNNAAEKKADEEDVKRDDEEGEKKRDWKDEKKGDDKGDEGEDEEEDEEEDDDSKDKDDDDKSKDKDGERVSNSRYSGINPALFYCHVCKKHMWDDTSFQNHLKGRTHQLMMDKLEESYKIKVELLRHELKVAEQQREIELDRMKRQGKKVHMNTREYCTMCDLHFFGNLVVHRKNDRHQHLKNFLHPRCSPCGKEFPTRIEWDHHKLTPMHLRKAAETRKTKKGDDDLAIEDLISPEGEEGVVREIEVRTKKDEEDEINEGEKPKDGADGDKAKDDKDAAGDKDADKGEGSIITTSSGTRFRVPKYNPEVAVGLSLLKKMTGQTCRACHRFFLTEEDSNAHCRTRLHYNNFVELVKEKAKAAEAKEKREAKAEAKKKEEKTEKDKLKRKDEGSAVDDEGNWKRRKVTNDEDEEEEADNEPADKTDEKMETSTNKEDDTPKKGDGNEKYDPLEADAENSSPEPESQESRSEATKGNEDADKSQKDDNIVGDDNLWAEVDRDIGTILDTVDGENENEESLNDLMEDEILNSKDETDSPAKGSRPASRRAAATAAAKSPATARGRGRKKK